MLKSNFNQFHKQFSENLPRSLERTISLLDEIGNPQNKIKNIIHIAGTNGKGSILSYIKSCLTVNNLKVNAFTSPHLVQINERILINNKIVEDKLLEKTIDRLFQHSKDRKIAFFEFITCCAIYLFNKHKADWNLFEVGMGGQFDATNILPKKDLAIITPISYDHEDFLGDDIIEITKEKIGITNSKTHTVVGKQPKNITDFILKNFLHNKEKRFVYGLDWTMTKKKESFYYEDNNTSIRINNPFMIGEHQKMNAALSIASLIFLNKFKKINLSKKFIEEGISKTKWRGRLEKINCKNNLSELWIDSCHNSSGTKAIAHEMKKMNSEKQKKMNLIFSLKKGKKIRDFIIPFEGIFDEIKYIGINDNHYSFNEIKKNTIGVNINIKEIKEFDKKLILKDDHPSRILICGSMQLVGKAISIF